MRKEKRLLDFNKAMLLLLMIELFIIIKAAFPAKSPGLEEEANIVLAELTEGNQRISLLGSEEISIEKLRLLDKMEYNEIKDMMGVKSDFCIYFEDEDGNIVETDDINPGIGSGRIYINGKPCK